MKRGMAEEIRNLQQCKRSGQLSVLDVMDVETLMLRRPCAFDRIDKLVLSEITGDEEITEYDPDDDIEFVSGEDDP